MTRRQVLTGAALAAIAVGAAGGSLDGRVRRRLRELFMSEEEIAAARAEARAEWRREQESALGGRLAGRWAEVAGVRAATLSFADGGFRAALVEIGSVATVATLNLAASDYRCGYCRADAPALRDLIRERPGRPFVFLEAAILGPPSLELAKLSLAAATLGKFPEAHEALFELSRDAGDGLAGRLAQRLDIDAAALAAAGPESARLLEDHLRLADLLGIRVTPTYVLDGRPRIGVLTRS
ncbi:MAG: DsbA family protein [Dongiaceae bacterium]